MMTDETVLQNIANPTVDENLDSTITKPLPQRAFNIICHDNLLNLQLDKVRKIFNDIVHIFIGRDLENKMLYL